MVSDRMLNVATIIIIINFLSISDSANILAVFPTASYSHQQPMLSLTRELANRGHNVTVFTTNPNEIPTNNHNEIDLSYFYEKWSEFQKVKGNFNLQSKHNVFHWIENFPKVVHFISETFFSSDEFQHFMKFNNATHYDLLIYESLFPSLLGLTTYFGNPHAIGILSLSTHPYTDYMMGNDLNPSYIPSYLSPYDHKMTFFQRFYNLLINLYSWYYQYFYTIGDQDNIMRKYLGESLPSCMNLTASKLSLAIFSSDLSVEYPRPMQINTVHVGALHTKSPKPLPTKIRKWLNEAEEGVIYFSLGSNMKGTSLSDEKKSVFLKVFKDFPRYRIIWKWEADEKLPDQPDNILVKNWIPQQDLLAHENVRLFISQAGLQSIQEAINWEVPVLAVPMFGDQFFIAKKLDSSGAGISLEFDDITFESLKNAIHYLLTDESYRLNMKKLSKISKDKPLQPLQNTVWWVEYVLRHDGAPHLKSASVELRWYQKYLLDVLLLVLIILMAAATLLFYTINVLFKIHFYKLKTS